MAAPRRLPGHLGETPHRLDRAGRSQCSRFGGDPGPAIARAGRRSRRPSAHRRALALAAAAAVLVGCADSGDGVTSRPATPPTPTRSSAPAPASPPEPASPPDPLVVVGHATRPQLDLTGAQARRLTSGGVKRWHGLRMVRGVTARDAVAAVEKGGRTLAVVPLSTVGPTVVAARVDGVDPVRDRPDAQDLLVVGDVMLTRGVPDAAAALAPMSRILRRG